MIILFPIGFGLLSMAMMCRQGPGSLREAVIKSFGCQFLFIALSTESLSILNIVSRSGIITLWSLWICIILLMLAVKVRKNTARNISAYFANLSKRWNALNRSEKIFLLFIAGILVVTATVALVAPPNNWDSMTYHMARAAEWIQHQNIDFYPTSIDRQNYQMPLAEFAIMHLQLLSGSDRFANSIQWLSFFMSIILVSLIVKEMSGSARAQILSALFAATLPMGVLQSTGTQNDLVAGAFCLMFAYFMLKMSSSADNPQTILFAAISLGLALFTKGTAYIYCCGIGVPLGLSYLFSRMPKTVFPIRIVKLMIIVFLGLLVSSGHFYRNWALYKHPLSTAPKEYRNKDLSASTLFSNALRNSALHLGAPSEKLRDYVYAASEQILGDQLNNPATTWPGAKFKVPFSLHEDTAGNLLHFLIIVFAIIWLPFYRDKRLTRIYALAFAVALCALLFCWFLKWQPWSSRLHTPIFLLASPLAGILGADFRTTVYRPAAIVLFCYAIPFLFINWSRPILPLPGWSILTTERNQQYFANRPYLYEDYRNAIKAVQTLSSKGNVEEVGLYLGGDDWEYPLWVLLDKEATTTAPLLRHVGVEGVSKSFEFNQRPPSILLATKTIGSNLFKGYEFKPVFTSRNIQVMEIQSETR